MISFSHKIPCVKKSVLTCLVSYKKRGFFENSEFVILECDTYNIPMCVWKHHGGSPSRRVIAKVQNKAKELFGNNVMFRTQMRLIPEHFTFT